MPSTITTQQIDSFSDWLRQFQQQMCDQLQHTDAKIELIEDNWTHRIGGGGSTRVLQGDIFERAGVNYSRIRGDSLPAAATKSRSHLMADNPFEAMGVSVVIHPDNPLIPTTHANIRLFVSYDKDSMQPVHWWFGGGFDLTPYYPVEEDCVLWHQHAKKACDLLGPDTYTNYKDWCDRYFTLPHRSEQRGIGGIFFDDLSTPNFESCFAFVQAVGNEFVAAYASICDRHMHKSYTQQQKDFQLVRRGRYTEFNLLYDRGTLFGLQSGGRTESILMSMPPQVRWEYNYTPAADSPEARLIDYFLQPKNWLEKTTEDNHEH